MGQKLTLTLSQMVFIVKDLTRLFIIVSDGLSSFIKFCLTVSLILHISCASATGEAFHPEKNLSKPTCFQLSCSMDCNPEGIFQFPTFDMIANFMPTSFSISEWEYLANSTPTPTFPKPYHT